MKSLVSIVVPVYNVEPYLGACLNTLRRQTCAEIEILCVDDASTDGSPEILAEAARHDVRIKLIQHPANRGLSAARNTGIAAASAPWILFVDSDDLVSEHICERTLAVAQSSEADVVFFTHTAFADGTSLPPEPPVVPAVLADRGALLRRPAFAWTKLVRTELLRTKHIEFPMGLCFEDVPVHWRLVLESSRPIFLDEALVWYRQRSGSITYRKDWTRADGIKIYDLVRDQLHQSGHWHAQHETFLAAEMANFANTHAYYALANPALVERVRTEARCRMTTLHWSLALAGEQLKGWQRDYVLARCRPKGVNFGPALVIPVVRQAIRDPLRRLWSLFRR
jgi:glycosyltransferase involved in cell wall biosynthesis